MAFDYVKEKELQKESFHIMKGKRGKRFFRALLLFELCFLWFAIFGQPAEGLLNIFSQEDYVLHIGLGYYYTTHWSIWWISALLPFVLFFAFLNILFMYTKFYNKPEGNEKDCPNYNKKIAVSVVATGILCIALGIGTISLLRKYNHDELYPIFYNVQLPSGDALNP